MKFQTKVLRSDALYKVESQTVRVVCLERK